MKILVRISISSLKKTKCPIKIRVDYPLVKVGDIFYLQINGRDLTLSKYEVNVIFFSKDAEGRFHTEYRFMGGAN